MARFLAALLCLWAGAALAHDQWANGDPVPPWVKQACCGPQDVHHLREEQVHALDDGYHVDGLATVIPYPSALPSPDGQYWGFWNDHAVVRPIPVYCFFAPVQSM